ncbi:MAG: trypsin-like peptidase domain-containing protein [Bacteroidales bacterium]|nr:trypsin-like peptidase domain-containing protein [Bacteroidales bacterium]
MKRMKIIALLVLMCLSHYSADAQTIPVYRIMSTIEQNALADLPGHEEWGMKKVVRNVHRTMPSDFKLNLPSPSKASLTPEQLYEKRLNGSLIFGKMYSCGQCPKMHLTLIASASAVTEDGVCLVNYHMIHPIVSREGVLKGDSVYFLADRDGQIFPVVEVMAYSKDEDAAVIRVDTRGTKLEAIPLGGDAATGSHVNLISHPKQMLYTYTQGYVTRNVMYNYPDKPIIDIMEVTAPFAEGSSGGPFMDDRGNLVGMVKGTNTIYYSEERPNPQMVHRSAIPVKVLKVLLGVKR